MSLSFYAKSFDSERSPKTEILLTKDPMPCEGTKVFFIFFYNGSF